jgi:tetratricopeptide (TPR) repeat protein
MPAAAQGLVQGTVVDTQGQPVEGAAITIEQEGTNRHFDMKTDKKGGFMQIGLASAGYKITATKDKLTASQTVRVSQGRPATAKLVLGATAAAASGAEAAAVAALRKLLDEAIAASNAGKPDEAIAGFTKAIEGNPTCFACYYNIGYNYAQKKDYANAETNYKKAIEMKADYVDAYAGLASIYNAQRKFDEAAAASAKVTEFSNTLGGGNTAGGGADAFFNQGVILWNGGKIAEAKKSFESAIQANPNHAEAHYQLGMALVNEGNLAGAAAEFETYLKLAPEGPNAPTAKGLIPQLKK